jgi:putative nucleotidyltransferase with HDIG domain
MNYLALDWLRQMNSAISVRHLYPADHPRAVAVIRSLEAATFRLTADHAEVSLFVVEGRLACNGDLVSGTDDMTARTFDPLRAKGYDRLTLRRGVSSQELVRLAGALAGRGEGPDAALQSSENIRLSVLDPTQRRWVINDPVDGALHASAELAEIWRYIDETRTLKLDAVEKVITPLGEIVRREDGMLPLAALRAHDEYTATHITNVSVLTMALAQALGLPDAAVRMIGVGALLHDIGKMKIPADILTAPGRLTAEQHVLVRRHPEMGARMLLETPGVPQLAVIVAYEHHLQADGGGYPSVPSGWRINPASEMTHVADVYDALRTHRPYRAGLDQGTIFEMMQRDRGTVFPEALLDVFLSRVVPRTRPADGPRPPGPTAGSHVVGGL